MSMGSVLRPNDVTVGNTLSPVSAGDLNRTAPGQGGATTPSVGVNSSPSTVVTLSKDADKGLQPQEALTYTNKVNHKSPLQASPATVGVNENYTVPPAQAEKAKPAEQTPPAEKSEATVKLQALAYGAIGLDKPAIKTEDDENFYTAGKVLKAVGTVGGLIALFI